MAVSALVPQGRPVGLTWHKRWGRWAEGAVYVLAAVVGEVEAVAKGSSVSGLIHPAMHEFNRLLSEELPSGVACVNIHRHGSTAGRSFRFRVALVCDSEAVRELQRRWQRRLICSGTAELTWVSSKDTASAAHDHMIETMLSTPHMRRVSVFAMELPMRWVGNLFAPGNFSVSLRPTDHWWDFASRFGDVVAADLMLFALAAKTARLVVRFLEPFGARTMYQALYQRYLYNPGNESVDDTFPVTCAIGDDGSLRAEEGLLQAQLQPLQPSSERRDALPRAVALLEGFTLRRIGSVEDATAGPAFIHVTPLKRDVVVGREACDVLLQRPHISKVHATLKLRPRSQAAQTTLPWMLWLQESSANGTWVNGKRVATGVFQELRRGDKVSFLPSNTAAYPDALLYEVQEGVDPNVVTVSTTQPAGVSGSHSGALVQNSASARRKVGNKRPLGAGASLARPVGTLTGVIELDENGEGDDDVVPNRAGRLRKRGKKSDAAPLPRSTGNSAGDDDVVEVGACDQASAPSGGSDLRTWLRCLDGGSLMEYEPSLVEFFDDVTQIKELYVDTNRLQDFFDDLGVRDANHRLAFASAFQKLRKTPLP
eukprot:TRINITY_DN12768_c0_g2_i1.p1 TRINITY_DN12768_c0_g2~~TRINITY_DN12768_c0_g2_i1.p1  ORF type:complete len:597 (-),score=106.82 TRINITY_DN12768_c0_g2_i1:124-1914(-)